MAKLINQTIDSSVSKLDAIKYDTATSKWIIATGTDLPEGVYQGDDTVITSGSIVVTQDKLNIESIFNPDSIDSYTGDLDIEIEAVANSSEPTYRLTEIDTYSYIQLDSLVTVRLSNSKFVIVYKIKNQANCIAALCELTDSEIIFIRSFSVCDNISKIKFAVTALSETKFAVLYSSGVEDTSLGVYDISLSGSETIINDVLTNGYITNVGQIEFFNNYDNFLATDYNNDVIVLGSLDLDAPSIAYLDNGECPRPNFKAGSLRIKNISLSTFIISYSVTDGVDGEASYIKKLSPSLLPYDVNWDTSDEFINASISSYIGANSRIYDISYPRVCILYAVGSIASASILYGAIFNYQTNTFEANIQLTSSYIRPFVPNEDPTEDNTLLFAYGTSTGEFISVKYEYLDVDFTNKQWQFNNLQLELPSDLVKLQAEELAPNVIAAAGEVSMALLGYYGYGVMQGFMVSEETFESAVKTVNLKGYGISDIVSPDTDYKEQVANRFLHQYKKTT